MLDPRLRVLYIAAVAAGVLLARSFEAAGGLLLAQCALWLVVGLGPKRLARQVLKLWGFALFILVSYALTSEDPATDRWVHLTPWLQLNLEGVRTGALMLLRVLSIVLASQIARAGDARAVAAGLGKLGVPPLVAVSIDTVLALLDGSGGGGRGDGSGGGQMKREAPGGFREALKRFARGDVGPLADRLAKQISRAERHAEGHPLARDIGVIAGASLTMLGIRALKILPNVPFAPGHKLVLLTPLYIVASLLTQTRLGGTLTGLTMGTVSFLMGDGKYGVFEILKHVAPGVICDLLLPLLVRTSWMNAVGWSVFGAVIAAGRFATILAITAAVQAPAVAYAILLPGFAVHMTFGALSGYVSFHLVRATTRLRAEPKADAEERAL